MNKSYCALPFRETMLIPGNVILLCCRHDTNVVIKDNFETSFKTGKIQEIRELMLKGEPVQGCEQCYREEQQGIKSMREQSIEKYGIVKDIEVQGLHIQFDNLCNLKCRMCTSTSSHLLYDEEKELFGKTVSWQKLTVLDKHNEVDTSQLTELRLHGGEPFLSKRVEDFFTKLVESNHISRIRISTPTNGMVKPNDKILEALKKCKQLSIMVSIDGYGKLNDYIRSKSNFDSVVENLNFLYSLIDLREPGTTTIGVNTTVNIYNVNKLKELDSFFKSNYPKLILEKSFLSDPGYLRISAMPAEYKEQIRHELDNYPEVVSMLNINDPNAFEEFVFQHNKLNEIRQESLDDINLELSEFIKNYNYQKTIVKEDIIKFHTFADFSEITK